MAELAGLVLGGAPLLETIAKSTISIINLIKSYYNHNNAVISFRKEIESLGGVVKEVQRVIDSNPTESATLDLPLQQCAQACKNFEILMVRCTNHFDGNKTSFRDWAQVKINEDEIVELKDVIATAKSTINIVINCINLRATQTTAEKLKTFESEINVTMTEWQRHLDRIEPRIQTFVRFEAFLSDEDAAERDKLQREKNGYEQCLSICARGATQAKELLQTAIRARNQLKIDDADDLASQLRELIDLLEDKNGKLDNAACRVESKLLRVDHQLKVIRDSVNQKVFEQESFQREAIQKCLHLCAQLSAKVIQEQHILESIAAESGSTQVILCKPGELINARNVKSVQQSFQVMGTASDTTVQQMSRDYFGERCRSRSTHNLFTEPEGARNEDKPHSQAIVITRTNKELQQDQNAPALPPVGKMRASWTKILQRKATRIPKTLLVDSRKRA